MKTAVIDQALQEAQDRLLEKRAMLCRTVPHGQKTDNIDFQAIADRCKEKSITLGKVYDFKPERETKALFTVPKLYQHCTFENFTGNEKLISDIRSIGTADVVLRGNTGTGKTHLAIAMGKTVTIPTLFTTVPDILLRLRSSFSGGLQTEEEIIREYAIYPCLILDDLGAENTSAFAIEKLSIILDRRIRECRRTIITTNLTKEQIEQTLGARIASRMTAMVNFKINMPDWRKKRG